MDTRKIPPLWPLLIGFVYAPLLILAMTAIVAWLSPRPLSELSFFAQLQTSLCWGVFGTGALGVVIWLLWNFWERGHYLAVRLWCGLLGCAVMALCGLFFLDNSLGNLLGVIITGVPLSCGVGFICFAIFALIPYSALDLPITIEEFEQEVKRVLAALDIDVERSLNVTVFPRCNAPRHHFMVSLEEKSFCLWIGRDISQTENTFSMNFGQNTENDGVLYFSHNSSGNSSGCRFARPQISPPEYEERLVRALFLLGYDIDSICEQIGMTVTAHEKLEWSLERREKEQEKGE